MGGSETKQGSHNAGGSGRALIIHPQIKSAGEATARLPLAQLDEAKGLAHAIGLDVRLAEVVVVNRPRPAILFGTGKVEELGIVIRAEEIEVAVLDTALSPIQQRNLEKAWHCKVIDRTGLILEIFADRAQTKEGRLQVELAQLTYQRSRLVRSWTHLERQRGGLGFVGGPGESQLEVDRRLIDERITRIRKDLTNVVRTRELHRAARRRVMGPFGDLRDGTRRPGQPGVPGQLGPGPPLRTATPGWQTTRGPRVPATMLPAGSNRCRDAEPLNRYDARLIARGFHHAPGLDR